MQNSPTYKKLEQPVIGYIRCGEMFVAYPHHSEVSSYSQWSKEVGKVLHWCTFERLSRKIYHSCLVISQLLKFCPYKVLFNSLSAIVLSFASLCSLEVTSQFCVQVK